MAEQTKLNKPWLVAVWPGMGHVAVSAGYYLMAKLEMHLLAEFSPHELFDVEHVEVKGGLIRTGSLPRSRIFVWHDPRGTNDIVLFIGDEQPPKGKYAFCQNLMAYAKQLGVERVFTFAAMATQMRPEHISRVFGAATDEDGLAELTRLELDVLEDGHIAGLNGVLLGVAAESGLRGTCLLGEMPHIFAQLPYPRASLLVLEVFALIAGIEVDFTELDQQAQTMDKKLGKLLAKLERAANPQTPVEEPTEEVALEEEEHLTAQDKQRIEQLFEQASNDRSKSYELKRELDRLGAFREYEDRFLDLFKKP